MKNNIFAKSASGYRLIFGYLGIFIIVTGIILLIPLLVLFAYPSEVGSIFSFLIPGVSSIAVGVALSFLIRKREKAQLGKFQDSILLILIWIVAILIGAIPFTLRGFVVDFSTGQATFDSAKSMGVNEAIFESTSGFSATGLTLFNFDPSVPGYHLYTFYRAILLLFGGVGLVLIVASAVSDRYGLKLYTAEGHNDKLMPNLAKSARMILAIYLGYIALGTLSYWLLGGLTLFDSICHSIAAVATGGFSTVDGGLPAIIQNPTYVNALGQHPNEIVINITSVVLMILGATNFVLHLSLFRGKIKSVIKDCEVKFFTGLCLVMVPLFFIAIWSHPEFNSNPAYAFGEGTFLFFSAVTTTGFATIKPILLLGQGAVILTIIMMCLGGGMGSTAGAIKQYRVIIASKAFFWSIRERLSSSRKIYPHSIYRLGQNREVNKEETYEAYGYIVLYIAVLLLGSLLITVLGSVDGLGFGNSLFEFASALSGTGLSVGVTSLAYQNSQAINWVLVCGMFAGRLEIVIIHFAFFRIVRDILRKETV